MRPRIVSIMALAAVLTGCSGQVRLDAGATGQPPPSGSSLEMLDVTQGGALARIGAREKVIAALTRQGHSVEKGAPARLEMGLTDRHATTGVAVIDGEALSPARGRKFLQFCKYRIYRLTLTYYGGAPEIPVTRAWAEERHCKGTIDTRIESLADAAVAALFASPSISAGKQASAQ